MPAFGFLRVAGLTHSLFIPFFNFDPLQSILAASSSKENDKLFVSPEVLSLFLPPDHGFVLDVYPSLAKVLEAAFYFYFFSLPSLETQGVVQFMPSFITPSSFFPNFRLLQPALGIPNADLDTLSRRCWPTQGGGVDARALMLPQEGYLRFKCLPVLMPANFFSPPSVHKVYSAPNGEETLHSVCSTVLELLLEFVREDSYPYVMASTIGFKNGESILNFCIPG